MIENYKYKYRSRGKIIFVPNEKCERRGKRMLKFFSKRVDFPDYFYHYKSGGHVAAMHAHIDNSLFFKIDVQNFYNSIARMRVTRALRKCGYPGGWHICKVVLCREPDKRRAPARAAYRLCPVSTSQPVLF